MEQPIRETKLGQLRITSDAEIVIQGGPSIPVSVIHRACTNANEVFRKLRECQSASVDIFEIIDFRMLSGLVGEVAIGMIAQESGCLMRNPNIDGYPDLICADTPARRGEIAHALESQPSYFVKYPHGGIELKNTFGVKASGKPELLPGMTRIDSINRRLEWKAHHQRTNHLLGLLSDFVDGCPQIVAAMYCDSLEECDWSAKHQPKPGSAMTSFTVLQSSGFAKMRDRVIFHRNDESYRTFLFAGGKRRAMAKDNQR